jgi:NADH-quinone oxidoreductase subunit J
MNILFYTGGAVAIVATFLVITRRNAVHALLYLILSLLSVALVFYALGAAFVALLEVIIYAGAIMVLFLFAIMMLNLGSAADEEERRLLLPGTWYGPAFLAAILAVQLAYAALNPGPTATAAAATPAAVEPRAVGAALFGPYLLAAELASILLLAGLVGAYHLGRRTPPGQKGGPS